MFPHLIHLMVKLKSSNARPFGLFCQGQAENLQGMLPLGGAFHRPHCLRMEMSKGPPPRISCGYIEIYRN